MTDFNLKVGFSMSNNINDKLSELNAAIDAFKLDMSEVNKEQVRTKFREYALVVSTELNENPEINELDVFTSAVVKNISLVNFVKSKLLNPDVIDEVDYDEDGDEDGDVEDDEDEEDEEDGDDEDGDVDEPGGFTGMILTMQPL